MTPRTATGQADPATHTPYFAALTVTALALLAVVALHEGGSDTFAPLVGAAAISAWYGGVGPGLASIAIAWPTAWLMLVNPGGPFAIPARDELLDWLMPLLVAVIVVLASVTLRRVGARAVSRAERAESQRAVTEAVQQLTEELSTAVSPSDVARILVERTPPLLGSKGAALGLLDGDHLRVVDPVDAPLQTLEPGLRLPLETRAPITTAARTGEFAYAATREQFVNEFPDGARLAPYAAGALAVELRSAGSVVGSLGFPFTEPDAIDDDVVSLAQLVAELGGQALERAELYEHERRSRKALDRIARLAPRFGTESPDAVLRTICLEARETFGADVAQLWEIDGEHLVVRHREPQDDRAIPPGVSVDVADFPGLQAAIDRLDTMFIADSPTEIKGLALEQARRFGIRSSLRVPIAVSGQAQHVLVLQWTRIVPEPPPSTLILASRFADQAGLALEHAERRLAQLAATHHAEETRRLLDVTAALSAAVDAQSVAEAATREALRSLGATAGVVVVTDGRDELRLVASKGYATEVLDGWQRFPIDAPVPLADAIRSDELVAVESPVALAVRYPSLASRESRHEAWLAVPLEAGGRVLGGLGLSFPHARRFTEGERSFALALAQQTGQALERAELLEIEHTARMRAERMAGDLAQLHAVTTSLGRAGHADEITRVIGQQTADGVETTLVCVFTVSDGRLALSSTTGRHALAERLGVAVLAAGDHTPLGIAVREATTQWVTTDEDWASSPAIAGWRAAGVSAVGVAPLLVGGDVIGALLLVFDRGRTPTDDDRRFVETVARQAAQPLDRLRLLAEERRTRVAVERANQRLGGLQTVTERLAAAPTMAAVAEVMIKEGRAALGGTAALVHVESAAGDGLELLAAADVVARRRATLDELGALGAPIVDALLSGEPVSLDDVTTATAYHDLAEVAHPEGFRALLGVPLTVGGRTIGVFTVGYDTPQAFTDDDRRTATAIGRQCAQALERSRLFDEERIARDRSDRLQGLTTALSGALTTQEVVEVFLDRTAPAVGASLLAIGLLDAQGRIPTDTGWEGDIGWIPSQWLEPLAGDRTPVRDAILRGVPIYFGGTEELESRYPEIGRLPAEVERCSFAFVPLVTGRKPFALTVLVWDGQVVLDEDDRGLVETFASQCAQAFDRAQRYETERTIAETLQRSVLPETLPAMEGATVAARYLPGTAAMDVGGDWFDTIPLADGRLGFVVGDVVGKGVHAASTMAQLRNGMRALTLDASDPARIVTKLNRLLGSYTDAPFATMGFVTVDPHTHRVAVVSAGHLPPLVLAPDGTTTFLTIGRALPLGVDPDTAYVAEDAMVDPGSTIVLYTDGLVERRDRSLDDGLRLLAEAVEGSLATPEELVDLILDRLIGDAERGDDVALLAIGLDREPLGAFSAILPAERASLVELRASFGRWLERAGVPEGERRDLVLAVWEASANAIEHARDPAEPTFSVEATLSGDTVHVEVADTGGWREPRERPDRGLGLDVIQSLMTSLEVAPGASGTRVVMERALERRRAGAGGGVGCS
jgi:GAF domain-containing protein/anti-sigma regulatory factor (Ser/Thr protein kinase)